MDPKIVQTNDTFSYLLNLFVFQVHSRGKEPHVLVLVSEKTYQY